MTEHNDIRTSLQRRMRELIARSDAIEDDLRRPLDADFSDQAIDLSDDEALAAVDDVLQREILEIKTALLRLAAGSYGFCAVCGDPIAKERLVALPTANRCVKCA